MIFLSASKAAAAVDPDRPVHRDTLNKWHDKIGGPRDSNGRRIFTAEVCEQIRQARQCGQILPNAPKGSDSGSEST